MIAPIFFLKKRVQTLASHNELYYPGPIIFCNRQSPSGAKL
jgi:hypothetical protein